MKDLFLRLLAAGLRYVDIVRRSRPRLRPPLRRASAAASTSSLPLSRRGSSRHDDRAVGIRARTGDAGWSRKGGNRGSTVRRAPLGRNRQRAWPAKQSAEIAALYHEAASYRSSPLRGGEAGGALGYTERRSPSSRPLNAGLQNQSLRATAPRSSGGPVTSRRAGHHLGRRDGAALRL